MRSERGLVRLWGTRGSIPVSGPKYVRHGGNTSCVEVVHGDERIVFDAGSGIRELGLSLLSEPPCKLHLFITHTHWDHIQGFPFFAPAFIPGYEISVYAAPNIDQDLESIFRGQLDRAYFPVQMEDMKAHIDFNYLGDEPVRIGDMEVSWEYTFHPGATVGYKVAMADKTLAFMPDNEFMRGYLGPPVAVLDDERAAIHNNLVNFLKGVDVLLHEAQYTQDEYPSHIGWGHTSLVNGCILAKLSDVGRWIVIHHDPSHGDDFLQTKLSLKRQILGGIECPVRVENGYDGMVGYL
jgi:ribonuclease BN (tRNA processing enzyme)